MAFEAPNEFERSPAYRLGTSASRETFLNPAAGFRETHVFDLQRIDFAPETRRLFDDLPQDAIWPFGLGDVLIKGHDHADHRAVHTVTPTLPLPPPVRKLLD